MEEKFYNEGKDAKYKFVICNMLKNNYNLDEMCNITNLSLNDIKKYRVNLDNVMSLDEHRNLRYDMCFRDGYYKRELQVAYNMLQEGYDEEFISKVTGLSINKIKELKRL